MRLKTTQIRFGWPCRPTSQNARVCNKRIQHGRVDGKTGRSCHGGCLWKELKKLWKLWPLDFCGCYKCFIFCFFVFEAVWRGVFGGRWPLKPLRKLWPLAAATAATADLPIHLLARSTRRDLSRGRGRKAYVGADPHTRRRSRDLDAGH